MIQQTSASALVNELANEGRRVVSDWRALILLRRATHTLAPSSRRWDLLPQTLNDVRGTLRQMERRGEIELIEGLARQHVYRVTVPYARNVPLSEYEVLMEVHPYAALAYVTALEFHGVTLEQPKHIVAVVPRSPFADQLPIGTTPQDWEGVPLVQGHTPTEVLGTRVTWTSVADERFFGIREYSYVGSPVRVTTLERTLIDATQKPDLAGGMENVLEAWEMAADILNLDLLVSYVERLDIGVLRQRIGFLLEELHLDHPILEAWKRSAQRGGSNKLLASAPYADTYSEIWNLSINASIAALQRG